MPLARTLLRDALDREIAIRVYAECHDRSGDLTEPERQAAREIVGV